ncbi:MAG: glycoside hydrolase family 65 protein [Chloroflexi bacterium]|nr:glycoside hydrolase family 65 protein [Chloroflexota bacterium]
MNLLTEDPGWHLSLAGFDPVRESGVEAVLTVGNGYAGTRGSLEEGTDVSLPITYLAGVFEPPDIGPDPPNDPEEAPALVVAPNWLALTLYVDAEQLSLAGGQILAHERVLDLRQGWVVRCWRHRLPSGRITRLVTLRAASLADRHAFVQGAWIVPENYGGRLRLAAALDGCLDHISSQSRRPVPVAEAVRSPDVLLMRAPHSHVLLAVAQVTSLSEGGRPLAAKRHTERNDYRVVDWWEWTGEPGHTYVFDRLVASFTSRQARDPAAEVTEHLERLRTRGSGQVLHAHRQRWAERWQAADVQIEGDDLAQRAVRFAAYHLMIAANPEDAHVSVAARGLTGDTYRGHVLWDTEIYLLPFFTFTWPAAARTLLMYRYHTLGAARAKAARHGYRGALYAWESAASGHEATARMERGPKGEAVPIVTWQRAHHVSADVAYGVWQYWRATADEEFFRRAGAEIILETARFWASRAQREADGRDHIRQVMGPDEYHEQVDDSAYTNWMARWNLEVGCETARWLQQDDMREGHDLLDRLGLSERELEQWRDVADHLVLQYDPQTKLIEQFAGYFTLEDVDLRAYHGRTQPMQAVLGRERIARTQVTKQADLVLLCYLLWEQLDVETIARNLAYYEPRCEQASSLSPSIYALVAARLGHLEMARHFFERSAISDLVNVPNAAQGVHLANCGGLWQAVVFGAAGMQLLDDGLAFDPHLLPGWRSLGFSVQWRGNRLGVRIHGPPARVHLQLPPDARPMCVRVGKGQKRWLAPGESVSLVASTT